MRLLLVSAILVFSGTCLASPESRAVKATTKALTKKYRAEIKRLEKKTRAAILKTGLEPEYLENGVLFLDIAFKQRLEGNIKLGGNKTLSPSYDLKRREGHINFTLSF